MCYIASSHSVTYGAQKVIRIINMGFLLSKFRKKKTMKEQLESIEQQIRSIEKFQRETEQEFRRVIGKLVVSSILIYIAAVIGYYYYYSPETFRDNIIKFLPLLVFPVAIIFFRKLLTYYYRRKLSKNESTLKTLKTDKKKILEEVMDKETYKMAKEILEKYAPDQLSVEPRPVPNLSLKAIGPATPPKYETTTRQRLMNAMPANQTIGYLTSQRPAFQAVPNTSSAFAQPRLSLPRPILSRDRGAFDKLIDFVVGDGPGHRYALICKVCSSHNGMALKHEFEYLAFRCAYCLQWNPARKQKPQAPYLFSDSGSLEELDEINSQIDITNPKLNTNTEDNVPEDETGISEKELESTRYSIEGEEFIEKENGATENTSREENDLSADTCSQNDITDIADNDHVPKPSANIDLINLQRALEEIHNDMSSSSVAATTSPTTESTELKLE